MKKGETLIGDVDAVGERNSYPVQYSFQENSMENGGWQAAV